MFWENNAFFCVPLILTQQNINGCLNNKLELHSSALFMLKPLSALLSLILKKRGSEYTVEKSCIEWNFSVCHVTFIDLSHFCIVFYLFVGTHCRKFRLCRFFCRSHIYHMHTNSVNQQHLALQIETKLKFCNTIIPLDYFR